MGPACQVVPAYPTVQTVPLLVPQDQQGGLEGMDIGGQGGTLEGWAEGEGRRGGGIQGRNAVFPLEKHIW